MLRQVSASLRYYFDDSCFDTSDGRLSNEARGRAVNLRPQAGRLLECFVRHPGQVIDRDTLRRAVWSEGTVVDFESGLAALLRELRQGLDEIGAGAGLIETVPRRGYRLRSEVTQTDGQGAAAAAASNSGRWVLVAVGVVIAVVVAFAAWRLLMPAPVTPAVNTVHSLAILPFERFGATGRLPEHADLLMADTLLASLWRVELADVELIGRSGMRPYRDREDVATAVAADLGVNLLIEGTLQTDGDRWQVDVRLLEIPPGRIVWSESLGGSDQVVPVAESASRLARRLAEDWPGLRSRLSPPAVAE